MPRAVRPRKPKPTSKPKTRPKTTPKPKRQTTRQDADAPGLSVREIDDLRQELARLQSASKPSRWNAGEDDVRRSVAKLVLTLVEFIRRVLERQAIRRHENGTLTPAETEAVGMALMRLEETIAEM